MKKNNLVIVTGASRGLGKEISQLLLKEGWKVVGISRSGSPELLGIHGFSEVIADLSAIGDIPAIAKRVIDEFGAPFGLVNNAAVGLDGLLMTQANTDIAQCIQTNLLSPILLTKYLSRHMLEARSGRVVNISSVVADTGYSGLSVYAATKAGLVGFSKSLSRELGRRGITVNTVNPGFMATDMTADLPSEAMEKIRRRAALSSLPSTMDAARAVAFLLGPGGDNITGTSIVVDAGNSA